MKKDIIELSETLVKKYGIVAYTNDPKLGTIFRCSDGSTITWGYIVSHEEGLMKTETDVTKILKKLPVVDQTEPLHQLVSEPKASHGNVFSELQMEDRTARRNLANRPEDPEAQKALATIIYERFLKKGVTDT